MWLLDWKLQAKFSGGHPRTYNEELKLELCTESVAAGERFGRLQSLISKVCNAPKWSYDKMNKCLKKC